jgi:hypothetical protein
MGAIASCACAVAAVMKITDATGEMFTAGG